MKGEVKVSLSCSGLERVATCGSLRLVRDGKELKPVSVIRSFLHGDGDAILRLREVVGVDEAESLRGAHLAVPEAEQAELPPDTYYVDDLVGLEVRTLTGEELGKVVEILEGPANAVCVVRKAGVETLLPVLKSVIRGVDLGSGRMTVEPPEVIDGDAQD